MGRSGDRVDLARLSSADLFASARAEILDDSSDSPPAHLVALHARPTREVFDAAAALLAADDPVDRVLGARVLRELGSYDDAGRRPFTADAVPLLVARLHQDDEPQVLGWVISALGYNSAREALTEVLRFTAHPDWQVRFHVAAALPSLVNAKQVETTALDAMERLCRDDDADTRFYALYALLEELPGVAQEYIDRSIAYCLNDSDEGVRHLARTHHDAHN